MKWGEVIKAAHPDVHPSSWSSASSPTQSGGAANEPPSQHLEYDHDAGDQ
jgi:hypothetical protein